MVVENNTWKASQCEDILNSLFESIRDHWWIWVQIAEEGKIKLSRADISFLISNLDSNSTLIAKSAINELDNYLSLHFIGPMPTYGILAAAYHACVACVLVIVGWTEWQWTSKVAADLALTHIKLSDDLIGNFLESWMLVRQRIESSNNEMPTS